MPDIEPLFLAFLIGFVPTLVWVMFWLLEDARQPEPPRLVVRAFAAGMLAVILVLPFQKLAADYFEIGPLLILIWASMEEVMKLGVAWVAVLRSHAVDEPIDFPLYLITVALGFAALENTLFLVTPLSNGDLAYGLITGNLRFIGATLIHVLSTATIAGALAFAFYKNRAYKLLYGLIGVILAVLLHTLFNFSIINTSADLLLMIFASVWVGILFLLLALEKIKRIVRPAWWERAFFKKH